MNGRSCRCHDDGDLIVVAIEVHNLSAKLAEGGTAPRDLCVHIVFEKHRSCIIPHYQWLLWPERRVRPARKPIRKPALEGLGLYQHFWDVLVSALKDSSSATGNSRSPTSRGGSFDCRI